jgi:deaminated glutathione amidase
MKIAAIQMTSGPVLKDNIATATRLINAAATAGAKLLLLPEYWPIMGMHEQDKARLAQSADAASMTTFLSQQAKQHGVCLIGGTVPLESPESNKVFNATLVFDAQGQQLTRYDKIHLFGFTKGSESYQESLSIVPGTQPVSFMVQSGADNIKVGLSICYDLRFPELYRAFGPVDLLVVPAAFTYTTGSVHWEILLRARAIENQCYVLAAGQVGHHPNGRHTWGHSMLIDPWGKIVAELPESEGFVAGELQADLIQEVRRNLPALQHRVLQ